MDRAGFALLAALLAVLLMAALIAGVFSATTEETKIGSVAAARQLAMLSAESAIEDAIAVLSTPHDPISIGETSSRTVAGLAVPAVVYVTRLDSSLYWLVAQTGGNPSSSGIARRIGVVVGAINRTGDSITIDRIPERSWSELF
jgi:Tfp pilus assembly protein PilX